MAPVERSEGLVVLLPGLWMPATVMVPLAMRLRGDGWRCRRFGYPSARACLDENAERLTDFIRAAPDGPVHLVGHSLGGVLALHATISRKLARVRSIVMLGSPAQGSFVAARLAERSWARPLLGRTVIDWLNMEKLPAPVGVGVGVIAGTHSLGLGMVFVPDLPRPHDGVIRVAETAVAGAADRIELPTSHAALLTSRQAARQASAFMRYGRFDGLFDGRPRKQMVANRHAPRSEGGAAR